MEQSVTEVCCMDQSVTECVISLIYYTISWYSIAYLWVVLGIVRTHCACI